MAKQETKTSDETKTVVNPEFIYIVLSPINKNQKLYPTGSEISLSEKEAEYLKNLVELKTIKENE